jgi:hypothetical protein
VIDDLADPREDFQRIMSLLAGETITVTAENAAILSRFCQKIGNEELTRFLVNFRIGSGLLSEANLFDRLLAKADHFMDTDEEVRFIALRFYKLPLQPRQSMPVALLELILESDLLRVGSEDELLEFIWGLGDAGRSFIRYLHCEFLTEKSMPKFISTVDPFNLNPITWKSICRRLQTVLPGRVPVDRFNCRTFAHRGAGFDGVLRYLTQQCGGNVHTKGIVNITASSTGRGKLEDIAGLAEPSSPWESGDVPYSWVMLDFGSQALSVDGYSLDCDGHSLTSFIIKGSNDGEYWATIDRTAVDSTGLHSPCYFRCRPRSLRFYRYIRFISTGHTRGSYGFLFGFSTVSLRPIEFFGRGIGPRFEPAFEPV